MQVGLPSLQWKEVELPSVAEGTLTKGLVSLFPTEAQRGKQCWEQNTRHLKYFANSTKAKCNCGKAGGISTPVLFNKGIFKCKSVI